jgi:hypothetical protein
MLTYKHLREVLRYEPQTGFFYWKLSRSVVRAGDRAGCYLAIGYEAIRIDRKVYYSHRLAWLYVYKRWPQREIDHINRKPLDNRIINLREASRAENTMNRTAQTNSTTGIKGIAFDKRRKNKPWRAAINNKSLGSYKTKKHAARAYDIAAQKYHGEFRWENLL